MKLIKALLYLIFVLIVLAVVVPILLMIFVNPNQFKPQIEKEVQHAVSQSLTIKGNLAWTFYPVAGIKANDVTFGQNLVSAKAIEFSVAVVPLLHKEIRVGKIEIDGMDLHLVKTANGQANWDINLKRSPSASAKKVSSPSDSVSAPTKIAAFSISQISIKNSQINLDDATTDRHIKITNFNFRSSHVSFDHEFPVVLSMTVDANNLASPVKVNWHSDLAFSQATKKLKLTDMHATLNKDLMLTGSESIVFTHTPTWRAKVDLKNINIENLLKLFKKNNLHISGTGNVSANLSGTGSTQNLNGDLKFDVQNGIFTGLDLYYYSDVADSLANKQAPSSKDTGQTPFGTLTGTAQIHNGVLSNNDLLIKANKINAMGKGTANLNSQQLDYEISLQRMTSGAQIKPRGPAIPIKITGSFDKPSVSVNWTSLATSEVKQQLSDAMNKYAPEINQKIQQGLNSLLGG